MPDPAQPNGTPEANPPGLRGGRMIRSAAIAAALRAQAAAGAAGTPTTPAAATPAAAGATPAPAPAPAPVSPAAAKPASTPAAAPDDDEDDAHDPETTKRLGTLQRQEEQQRKRIAAERAELDRERATFAAERAELEKFRAAFANAKSDPLALLRAAGYSTPEDFEYAGRWAAAASRPDDPKVRDAMAFKQREREQGSALDEMKRRFDELEQKLTHKEQSSALEGTWNGYLDHAVNAINGEAPLAKAKAANNPAQFRAELRAIAQALLERDGEVPDYADLVSAYEQIRRAELAEFGIDLPSGAAAESSAAPPTKHDNPAAKNAEQPPVTDPGTPSEPRPRRHRRDLLRSIA